MKKKPSRIQTILSVLMIVGAVMCLIFSAAYQDDPGAVAYVTDLDVSRVKESASVYMEELEVLERYAFQTIHEHEDSDGIYSDVQYYVYDASQPMDSNRLFGEYYIVKFRDKTGEAYITSLSVSAFKRVAPSLRDAPVTISACVGMHPLQEDSAFTNNNDLELHALREAALDAYAQKTGIRRAGITLGYQEERVSQYQEGFERDVSSAKTVALVFGILLAAGGAALLSPRKKKAK